MKMIALVGLLLTIAACAAPPQHPSVGEKGVLRAKGHPVVNTGADQESFDAYIKAAVAKDETGYKQLVSSGRVLVVDANTKVLVIDKGFSWTQVRILNGEYAERAVFVAKEHVLKN